MNTSTMIPVIAIDGPTASGKGAVAQAVAHELGFHYLDSGALYRLVALQALRAGWTAETELDVAHEQQLAEWASALDARFLDETILLDGEDVSQAIRQESTGNMASKIATVGALRQALLQRQRDFAQAPGLVAPKRGRYPLRWLFSVFVFHAIVVCQRKRGNLLAARRVADFCVSAEAGNSDQFHVILSI